MDIYYSVGNPSQLTELALEAGRAAHMLRNYTQGYVNLNHPEVATCDNLCGQIEAQIRILVAHIREGKEVKQILSLVGKTAVFLGKILEPGFLADAHVDDKKLAVMMDLLKVVKDSARKIDSELNLAIVKSSMSDFGEGKVDIPGIEMQYIPSEFVNGRFDPMDSVDGYAREYHTAEDKQDALFHLGSHLSNKAHAIQDAVACYLLTPPAKETAGAIINTAGAMENDSRAVLNICCFNRNPPQDNLNKVFDKISNNLKALRTITEKDDSPLKEVHHQLHQSFADHERILNTARTVLTSRVG